MVPDDPALVGLNHGLLTFQIVCRLFSCSHPELSLAWQSTHCRFFVPSHAYQASYREPTRYSVLYILSDIPDRRAVASYTKSSYAA